MERHSLESWPYDHCHSVASLTYNLCCTFLCGCACMPYDSESAHLNHDSWQTAHVSRYLCIHSRVPFKS